MTQTLAKLLSVDLKRCRTAVSSSDQFEPLTRTELKQQRRIDRCAASDELTNAVTELVRTQQQNQQKNVENNQPYVLVTLI